MESKKINQLATNVAPQTSDLTIIGDPITGVSKKITLMQIANLFATTGTVTSVAVTETGDALTITGSPITSAGTINIGFAGDATQYVRGDGALADFPTSTGGGSSVSYYLNSSVSQGTIGGNAYRQLSKTPVIGVGTDITISANGYVANYITDANDPALLEVPGGNFNCEFYFSVNSNNHDPFVYAELYKYDGTTFTLLGSNQAIPDYLSNGTTLSAYYFAIPVATAALTITDRLAIRIYVNVDGRVVTLHTENGHLCQVVTTFSKGLTSLNNLTRQVQFLATGTSGTDFNISSSTATHTFNLPVASATNTGKLSSTDWSTFNGKQAALSFTAPLINTSNTISIPVATASVDGYLDNADWTIFNNKQNAITLTTTGTSGAATLVGATLNIPNYADQFVGTVTSVGLSSATSGVTIGSSPITTSGTITLAIATASGSQNGLLSSTDWNTFNGKQAALNGTGFVKASGTTITYDNTSFLPLTGGTLTGNLTGTNFIAISSPRTTTFSATGLEFQGIGGSVSFLNIFNGADAGNVLIRVGSNSPYETKILLTGSFTDPTNPNANPGTIIFSTQSTEKMRLTSSGNLGVGTTTNALSKLQVVGTGTVVRFGEESGTTGKQILFGVDSATGRGEIQAVWQGTSNTALGLNVAGGNVLIGTTTDNGAKLQVGQYSSLSQVTTPTFVTLDNSYAASSTQAGDKLKLYLLKGDVNLGFGCGNIGDLNAWSDGIFRIYTGGNESMRINSNGNVGVGTTYSGYKMQVYGGSSYTFYINQNQGNAGFVPLTIEHNVSSGTIQLINFYTGAGASGSITSSGTTASFNATSDYRLKEDLKDFNGLDKVSAIKVYDFKWKNSDLRSDGVIAHELLDVLPYAVVGEKDALDKNGKIKPQGVDYSKIVPVLIKSIQELEARIKQLENK